MSDHEEKTMTNTDQVTMENTSPDPANENTDEEKTNDLTDDNVDVITKSENDKIQKHYVRIMEHYKTSVEGIIKTGEAIDNAKKDLKKSFRELEKLLPFSSTIASYYVSISRNKYLSNPDNWGFFPPKYNTCYEFSKLPDDVQDDKLTNGEITPQLTAKTVKSWNSKTQSKQTADPFRFEGSGGEKLYKVGMIAIAEPEQLDDFQQELNALLKKYNGKTKYAQSENSLAGWYNGHMLEAAEKKVAETAGGLENKHIIKEIRALDIVVKYLEAPRNKKAEVEGAGKKEKIGLPTEHEHYNEVSALIGSKDVTIITIKEWCKQNNFPNRTLNPVDIDKEVYVWELLRQIAENNNPEKEMGFLQSIADTNPNETIKAAAHQALASARKFQNN